MIVLTVRKAGEPSSPHAFTYRDDERADAERDRRRFILAGWHTRLNDNGDVREDDQQ